MRSWVVLALVASLLVFNAPISWGEDGGESVDEVVTTPDDAKVESPATAEHKERKLRTGGEKFQFQAEVNRLMDIIINSLYSNKDIFLRELISNASDALDKIRFLALTDKTVLGEGDSADLDIRISLDKDSKVLKIRDKGIGMTKDDLIKNLGTIAKSGTSAFLEKMQKAGDLSLIGQFGVGFYSVYLVADYVEVVTKHNDDKQYIWESKADGQFAISEDVDGEPLGRGTQVNIYLKDDTMEYAEEGKLTELLKKYSEFINFPIYMYTSKEVEIEEDEEDDVTDEENVEDADDVEDADEAEPKEKAKETVWDWELVNDSKAIWLRTASQVTDEEYQNFYKGISKSTYDDALTWSHFKAEGDVEFKALIYIPSRAPFDFYDRYYDKDAKSLKLYVRRVFISDEFDELLPRYLSFLVGLVDSDTLPLNVSREMLQQHASLKTIRKKLVRKALDMLKKMAEAEKKKDEDDDTEDKNEAEEEQKSDEPGKYTTFWNEFGRALKMGIIEDNTNRNKLAKLLRFHSSKSPDTVTSLEDYVSRMKEGQTQIYYLCGQSQEELEQSPFLEKLLKKGLEVIYFTESMDEYVMQHLLEFDDKKFQNASKEDLKFGDKDDKEKKAFKKVKEEFKSLTNWWKGVLDANEISAVKLSNRLATSPCVVVTSQYGWSANMERIMKAQAFQDSSKQQFMKGKRTLEINPYHPLIKELKSKFEVDEESDETKNIARLLYDSALLESGFVPDDGKDFADRLRILMKDAIGLKGDLNDIEEPVFDDADDEEDEEEPEIVEEVVVEPAVNEEDEESLDVNDSDLEHDEL